MMQHTCFLISTNFYQDRTIHNKVKLVQFKKIGIGEGYEDFDT